MRVLVTGAGGFVGSHVVAQLGRDSSVELVCLDSFQHNGDVGRLDLVLRSNDFRAHVTVLTHDLRAPLSIRQLGRVGTLDCLVNVASGSSVDDSIADPVGFITNNVTSTLNMIQLATDAVCRYVHVSTDEVYGSGDAPCSATHHRPSSPYAASKAAQEDVCHAYARTYDVPVTIVTSANMFGERQSQRAFIPRVVACALRNDMIMIHTANGYPGSRRYSYVGDVAQRLVETVLEPDRRRWPDRVALPGRYHVDNREVVFAIANILDWEPRYRLLDAAQVRPGYDPRYEELDSDEVTWLDDVNRPGQTFLERLGQTVEWFTANPEWLR